MAQVDNAFFRSRNRIGSLKCLSVESLLASLILMTLTVSNIVYGTGYAFNHQTLVPIVLSLTCALFISRGQSISYAFLFLITLVIIYGFLDALLSDRLIAIYHTLIAVCFFVASFCSTSFYGTYVSKLWPVPVLLGVVFSFDVFRDLGFDFNKNWLAMTSFYLLALLNKESKRRGLLVLGILCLIIGSRGGLVVCAVASLLTFSEARRTSRLLCLSALLLFMVLTLMFLHYYLENLWLYEYFYRDGPGLGGRDVALLMGYKELVDSVFLGHGIGFDGTFSDVMFGSTRDKVYIHFGLLDLFLKTSIIGVFFVVGVIVRSIIKSGSENFPFIFAGVVSVFFYNGLGLSHFGLNFFLYVLLGLGLSGPAKSCKWLIARRS